MISDLPTKRIYFKRYHRDKHFSDFLPTRWRKKSTGIDMEQNHVTVTLCILAVKPTGQRVLRPKQAGPKAHRFAVIGVIPF